MRPFALAVFGLIAAILGSAGPASAQTGGYGPVLYNHPPPLVGWWSPTVTYAPVTYAPPVAYPAWGVSRVGCSCCGCGARAGYATVAPAPVYHHSAYTHRHTWHASAYGYGEPVVRRRTMTHDRFVAPRYYPSNRRIVAPVRPAPVIRERTVRPRTTVVRRSSAASAATSTRTVVKIR